MGYEPAIEIN